METVFARLAPLEARLAEIERLGPRLAALEAEDPQAAMAELRQGLEALQTAQGEAAGRLIALQAETAEMGKPYAAIAEQLTRLYAQKDALVEAVFARLGPLEARLAALESAT